MLSVARQCAVKASRSASVVPADAAHSSSLAPQAFASWQSTNSMSGACSAPRAMQAVVGHTKVGSHVASWAQYAFHFACAAGDRSDGAGESPPSPLQLADASRATRDTRKRNSGRIRLNISTRLQPPLLNRGGWSGGDGKPGWAAGVG